MSILTAKCNHCPFPLWGDPVYCDQYRRSLAHLSWSYIDQNSASSAGTIRIWIHLRPLLLKKSWSMIDFCLKGQLEKFYLISGCSTDQCIVTKKESLLSEHNSTVGRIPLFTSLVWLMEWIIYCQPYKLASKNLTNLFNLIRLKQRFLLHTFANRCGSYTSMSKHLWCVVPTTKLSEFPTMEHTVFSNTQTEGPFTWSS